MKLPQLHGKAFAQGRVVVEEGRRGGSTALPSSRGLHGDNASFLPLPSPATAGRSLVDLTWVLVFLPGPGLALYPLGFVYPAHSPGSCGREHHPA